MNILQQEDIIKGLPDQALQEEAKRPSGQVPQFLVVSEIQRRTDMRKRYQDPNQQQPQGTIADQITQEGIASVQPQQPMQGQQQQGQPMPMRGGGMTPFMRKYAGGGVVRMQEGGITPHEMAQMDAQMMAQKYPFLSGSRDEILQGLSTVDPNDVSYISSMFNGAPEIEAVLASRSKMPQPPMPIENITEPSLLTLDGVNTLTPDGRRPNPNTPSVDTLEQFSNAFKEDAARAKNLLATLDDSTAKEKEAISNPVNVNLPKKVNADEDYFSGLGFDQEKDTSIEGILAESQNALRGMSPQDRAENMLSNIPSGYSSRYEGEDNHQAKMRARTRAKESKSKVNSLLAMLGDGSGGGSNIPKSFRASQEQLDEGNKPVFDAFISTDDLRVPQYQMENGQLIKINGSDSGGSNSSSAEDLINFSKQQGSPSRQQLIANSQFVKPPVAKNNNAVISDGANNEGSGDKGVNNSNKAVNLLNNAFELDLDATKKEAFAMAMIQLGAGIAKGDLAEGLSNAGVAASGVLERSRDRSDKQLDRDIQRKYYDDKLSDSRLDRESRIRRDAGTSALKKYTAEATSPLNLAKFAKMSQAEKDQLYDTIFQEELRVLTQSATGSDMRRGGNLAESLNEDPLGLRKT
jgi:hypothetical protein